MPYFSVVIPVYNTEAWIEKTLKAVLGQTFSDFEIILVDDGSTDNSVSIADSFHTQKLKIIKQCNSGVSVARNAGIAEAKGKYIAFLDADDYWFDDHLAEAKNFFDTFDNYPWYSSTPIIREEKDQLNNINRKATKYYFINFVSSGAKYTHSSSVIIRNDIAKQHPFPVGITNFEDVITFMQISVDFPEIAINARTTMCYINHANSSSKIKINQGINKYRIAIERLSEIQATHFQANNQILKTLIKYYLKSSLFHINNSSLINFIFKQRKNFGFFHSWNWIIMLTSFRGVGLLEKWGEKIQKLIIGSLVRLPSSYSPLRHEHSPLFSIVLPVYNKEESIISTIDCILKQTFQNFEIIVIDDGSTDKSLKKIQTIKDKRIHIIQQKNGGVSSARNAGIRNAKGIFIAFLDPDDYWYPCHLEFAYQYFSQNDAAPWYYAKFDKLTYPTRPPQKELKYHIHHENFLINNIGTIISSLVCRQDFIKETLFNEDLCCFEDIEWLFRLARKYPEIAVQDASTRIYYITTNSLTNSGKDLNIEQLKKAIFYCAETNRSLAQKNFILRDLYALYFKMTFSSKDIKTKLIWLTKEKHNLGIWLFGTAFLYLLLYALRGILEYLIDKIQSSRIWKIQ